MKNRTEADTATKNSTTICQPQAAATTTTAKSTFTSKQQTANDRTGGTV